MGIANIPAPETVNGYLELSEKDRKIFKKFLTNFFKYQWEDDQIILTGIYRVQDIEYIVPSKDHPGHSEVAKRIILKRNRHNNWIPHIEYDYKFNDHQNSKIDTATEEYLRVEYIINTKEEWLHIAGNGEKWY